MASADFLVTISCEKASLSGADPGSPQVRTQSFSTQPLGLRRLTVDHKSFAVRCPLALVGDASYPVLVHRLMDAIHPSSPRLVTSSQLGFTSLAVASSREDLHLQDRAHAGRTTKKAPGGLPGAFLTGWTRLELAAFGVTGRRSNQLSYHPLFIPLSPRSIAKWAL